MRLARNISLTAALFSLSGLIPISAHAQSSIACPFSLSHPSLPDQFAVSGAIDNQTTADCAAWQQFVYLNWQAVSGQTVPDTKVTASQFGLLPSGSTTVWQSYTPSNSLFQPSTPADRQTPPPLVLKAISKYGNIIINGIDQASGAVWLTGQNQNLTYYDVRSNPNEVAYISTVSAGPLNNAAAQLACVNAVTAGQAKGGFRLPMGYKNDSDCNGNSATYGDDTGTIELKAAWLILTPGNPSNARYLTAQAQVTDPYGVTTEQTVGLVGLHIIRRLPGASQMLWSTFEQVDNSPDYNLTTKTASDPRTATGAPRNARIDYAYFNAACDPTKDTIYQCVVNSQPAAPCPTSAGRTSTNPTCYPYNAPQQVGRTTPLEFHANGVNAWIWSQIPQNSVFQYYRLIDVQWPNTPQPPLLSGALTAGVQVGSTTVPYPTNMVPNLYVNDPNTRVIANTTMETYVQAGAGQATGTCMDCHASAGISALTPGSGALQATLSRKRIGNRFFTVAPFASVTTPTPGTTLQITIPQGDYLSSFSFIFSNATIQPTP